MGGAQPRPREPHRDIQQRGSGVIFWGGGWSGGGGFAPDPLPATLVIPRGDFCADNFP